MLETFKAVGTRSGSQK